MKQSTAPLLDPAHAAFIQGGVSISVGACDRANRPVQVRAIGCRVTDDCRQVTVFVSVIQAAQLLQCIRDSPSIAVVFSQPSTHRTVQLKGNDARSGALQDSDPERIRAYRNAFATEVEPLGFSRLQVRTLLSAPLAELVTLSFTPIEAYSQTPGPQAGSALKALAS